ncbi:phage tail sheath C-terminal domain-containing protein [Bradyrhizobium sp. 613_E4_N2_2]|uniref:phage tail sheath C-terminal domain-containing protein n=1 Tax=Bradyrhizobium sp. 613_E4_N2_2 TaxID=3240371 RepID=UPI003F8C775D
MADQFLHGVEVVEIDDGSRTITTASSSIIGIVGTAPLADEAVFPLNVAVLIPGSEAKAAKLNMGGEGNVGTLPDALDSIFDQSLAAVVVIRVEEGENEAETIANVIGGTNAVTGKREGVHALLDAESALGAKPRILIAPGFTQQRVTGGVLTLTGVAGTGYTPGSYDINATGGGGTGAVATVVVEAGGTIASRTVKSAGSGYTTVPTFPLTSLGGGTGGTIVATIGTTGNAVVAELTGIADKLRAVIVQDGPSTTDEAAVAVAGDSGSRRVYLVDPKVLKVDSTGATVEAWASACVAGVIARTDNAIGWWVSPSNKAINGIVGTARAIEFSLGSTTSQANLLNEANVTTIIRQGGFLTWGNRTLSTDAKWAFLCVVRTADIIADSLQAAHLWAVDQGITKNYVGEVQEGVNAFLRDLKAKGAILGGTCWVDKDLNSESSIAAGQVYWDFDFTPVYPAEHLTFRSHLVNDYISEIF